MEDNMQERPPGDAGEGDRGRSGIGWANGMIPAARRQIHLLLESTTATIGVAIFLFWVLVAIFAPLISPYSPTANYVPMIKPLTYLSGHGYFILGTDHLGRDVLSRVIFGARTVLIYAPLSTGAAYLLGIFFGLLAGYKRGWIDELLSRTSDLILAFPVLVLYLLIISKFGASGINIVIAVTFGASPGILRIVRGLTLDIRNRAYVAAAQTRGESSLFIMFAEILPNVRGPLIVDACLRLGYVTVSIGTLGFLGLGLPPPTPDWGSMINETRQYAMVFPHMVIYPCLAISSLVLGLNMLADGLREISRHD